MTKLLITKNQAKLLRDSNLVEQQALAELKQLQVLLYESQKRYERAAETTKNVFVCFMMDGGQELIPENGRWEIEEDQGKFTLNVTEEEKPEQENGKPVV